MRGYRGQRPWSLHHGENGLGGFLFIDAFHNQNQPLLIFQPQGQEAQHGFGIDNPLVSKLKELDVNMLTPIEALQTLYDLVKEAQSY